jgi:hypothetical protein
MTMSALRSAGNPRRRVGIALTVLFVGCFTAAGARADYPLVSKHIPATTYYRTARTTGTSLIR